MLDSIVSLTLGAKVNNKSEKIVFIEIEISSRELLGLGEKSHIHVFCM
jgi:hypothetical protein